MKTTSIHIAGVLCLVLLFQPLLLSRCDREADLSYVREVEMREPAPFPSIESPASLVDAAFYASLSAALRDRIPFRGRIITLTKRAELALPGNTQKGDVLMTGDGWYYYKAAFGRDLGSPADVQASIDLVESFLDELGGPPPVFRFVLVPDKHTVYPEYLDQRGRTEARVWKASRDRIHDHFAGSSDPRVIDMRALILAEKEVNPNLLYQPADTHHSDHGAMVMVRAIISSIDPSLWRDEEVVFVGREERTGDLHKLAGLVDTTEPYDVVEIRRPGVEITRWEWLSESEEGGLLRPGRYWVDSSEALLLPGRGLVVHDSFIGPTMRSALIQYFEDLTFWYNELVEPGQLEAAVEEFDYVIVENTVRESTRVLAILFGEATEGAPAVASAGDSADGG